MSLPPGQRTNAATPTQQQKPPQQNGGPGTRCICSPLLSPHPLNRNFPQTPNSQPTRNPQPPLPRISRPKPAREVQYDYTAPSVDFLKGTKISARAPAAPTVKSAFKLAPPPLPAQQAQSTVIPKLALPPPPPPPAQQARGIVYFKGSPLLGANGLPVAGGADVSRRLQERRAAILAAIATLKTAPATRAPAQQAPTPAPAPVPAVAAPTPTPVIAAPTPAPVVAAPAVEKPKAAERPSTAFFPQMDSVSSLDEEFTEVRIA